jgi:hypothetical protein
MYMNITNGNSRIRALQTQVSFMSIPTPIAPTALNASIIARIHTTKPGCSSCGRH